MTTRILIADRDRGLAEALERCLVHRGYVARYVIQGMECIEQLQEFTPDALILDSQILWGGGAGVLHWLIEDEPTIPIIVIQTDDPNNAQIPVSLETRINFRIDRPKKLDDILPFVSRVEDVIRKSLTVAT